MIVISLCHISETNSTCHLHRNILKSQNCKWWQKPGLPSPHPSPRPLPKLQRHWLLLLVICCYYSWFFYFRCWIGASGYGRWGFRSPSHPLPYPTSSSARILSLVVSYLLVKAIEMVLVLLQLHESFPLSHPAYSLWLRNCVVAVFFVVNACIFLLPVFCTDFPLSWILCFWSSVFLLCWWGTVFTSLLRYGASNVYYFESLCVWKCLHSSLTLDW